MTAPTTLPLSLDDIAAAAVRIAPHVHRTDVLRCAAVDARAGRRVHLKAEHLQRSGSFKARGAHNKLLVLDRASLDRGVVTVSSGNHATALACAGRRLGVRVDVFMPHDAPELKQRAARSYGATIHPFDRAVDDRATLVEAHVARHGSVVVEPFDDLDVMAGQGTTAVEVLEQTPLDTLVVPMSGGGLMAGCAVAARSLRPDIRMVGVEPAGAADTQDGEGALVEGFPAQMKQALDNLEGLTRGEGLVLDDVLRLVVYLDDMARIDELNRIFRGRFAEPRPTRTTVAVAALPGGATVELEATLGDPSS